MFNIYRLWNYNIFVNKNKFVLKLCIRFDCIYKSSLISAQWHNSQTINLQYGHQHADRRLYDTLKFTQIVFH